LEFVIVLLESGSNSTGPAWTKVRQLVPRRSQPRYRKLNDLRWV